MHELGLLGEFLQRPHQEAKTLSGQIGEDSVEVANFASLPTHCRFIAFMPQWDFLNFIAEHAKRYPIGAPRSTTSRPAFSRTVE